jgi:hypothetical protein
MLQACNGNLNVHQEVMLDLSSEDPSIHIDMKRKPFCDNVLGCFLKPKHHESLFCGTARPVSSLGLGAGCGVHNADARAKS